MTTTVNGTVTFTVPDPVQGIQGIQGLPGVAGVSPTAASVAAVLAATPSFVSAVAAAMAAGTTPVVVPPPVVTPPVVTPTPPPVTPAGTSWVYHGGVFYWPGDYSYSLKNDYAATDGAPTSGTLCIKCSLTGAWGGWQPYALNWNFDLTPFNYLIFSAKTTVANQQWNSFALKVGDKNIVDASGNGISVDINKYGPTPGVAPVVGKWCNYKIPLAAIMTDWSTGVAVRLQAMYKFDIHDETGLTNNVFFVDNVGFTAT